MHTHITNGFTRRLHLHPDETAFLPSSHLCRNAPSGTLFESTTQSFFPLPLFCNLKRAAVQRSSHSLSAQGPTNNNRSPPGPHR